MYIDIFLGVFVLIGLIQGFHRGIIRTFFSIVGFFVGVLAAMKFSPLMVNFFDQAFGWKPLLSLIFGVLLTFILIMWGINWLGRGLEKTLKAVKLNFFNQAAGAILFAALMVVAYSAVAWFLAQTEIISEQQKLSSRSWPYLVEVTDYVEQVFHALEPVFKGFWDKIEDAIQQADAG